MSHTQHTIKTVQQIEYTIEVPADLFKDIAKYWWEEMGSDLWSDQYKFEDIISNKAPDMVREVLDYIRESSHVGNYTDLVTVTQYNITEESF